MIQFSRLFSQMLVKMEGIYISNKYFSLNLNKNIFFTCFKSWFRFINRLSALMPKVVLAPTSSAKTKALNPVMKLIKSQTLQFSSATASLITQTYPSGLIVIIFVNFRNKVSMNWMSCQLKSAWCRNSFNFLSEFCFLTWKMNHFHFSSYNLYLTFPNVTARPWCDLYKILNIKSLLTFLFIAVNYI